MSSADQIEIRSATPADRDFVLGLVPRLRAFGPPPLRPPEALDEAEVRALSRAFAALPDGAVLFVAEHPRHGALGVAYAETATDYFTQEKHGHLAILMVAEAGEGKGAGRALLTAVESWSARQGHRFITLNVFAGNSRARTVYERAGYTQDTIRYLKEL
ncbi:MAG TPA: GNAT family N-acetyltransferase [Thermoanaerobaculia bacterium]|nr:GNAT family N-acetyltransferase [Thermoanaerobaculia bacterium]